MFWRGTTIVVDKLTELQPPEAEKIRQHLPRALCLWYTLLVRLLLAVFPGANHEKQQV